MIIIATILDIVWEFILSGVSLGLKAARLILLGTIMSVRYLRSHQEHHRVHGESEPIDLDRWMRDWLPYGMSQHLTLILFGPFFGTVLAYFHYTTFWRGLIVGAVISVVASLVEIQNYRQRIERERQKRMLRLFNVALAEFPIPSDQGFTWWISVRRWLTWPAQLRPSRQVRSRWPNDLGETFPGLIRFRLPPDYRPSREARDDFTEHLHEATKVTMNTGLQWIVTWDIPQHAVWAEITLAKIDAPYPDDWPALEHPRLIPIGKRRDGERRYWNADADPMGAIAGRTGTGKTIGIGTLVIGCGRAGWNVYLVDGKMTGLGIFRNRQGVRVVAVEPDGPQGWWTTIDAVYRELQSRKRVVARGDSISMRPPVLLVVDEVPTVLALRRGRTADVLGWNEPRREAQRKLTEIASQGRSLDIHYWPSGQRLAAIAVEGPMRENLSALLIFRSTLVGSMQAMESTAAARLPKMPGRAMWTDVQSDGEEIQGYSWTAMDLDRLLPRTDDPVENRPVSDRPRVDAYGFQDVTHSG